MNSDPDDFRKPWFIHPERPVSGWLVCVHVFIIAITLIPLIGTAIFEPEEFQIPYRRLGFGLFAVVCCTTGLSLLFNWGWWTPFMVIGMAIAMLTPIQSLSVNAWSMIISFLNVVVGMFFGILFGGFIEFFRRRTMTKKEE